MYLPGSSQVDLQNTVYKEIVGKGSVVYSTVDHGLQMIFEYTPSVKYMNAFAHM